MSTRTLTPLALVLTAAVASAACGPGEQVCTDLYAFGLTVTVEDAAGTAICDATVTATEGDHVETLSPSSGDDCSYSGAGERAGTYRVEASKAGFVTAVEDDVVVEADECHVIGEVVTLVLLPE